MKKRIGELYNKPVVIGDKNLLTKNEVHKENIANFLDVDLGDMIFVGFKEPVIVEETNSVDTPVIYALTVMANGLKFSNNKYFYGWGDFGENLWDKELCLAAALLKIPKMPHNPYNMLCYETYNELVNSLSVDIGVSVDEIKDLIFPMSRDESFQKVKEDNDYLELDINGHYIKVDFHNGTFMFDDEVGNIEDEVAVYGSVSFVERLGRIGVSFNDIVAKDVKYVTSTSNYVEYYNKFSSDVYYNGRIKTNGTGPDLNYGEVSTADGYRHSSGLIVRILE